MPRSSKPPRTGAGLLLLGRETHRIDFSFHWIEGYGQRTMRGGLTGEADAMRLAFVRGQGVLRLDDGVETPITIVAHAAGDRTAYFESGPS